jgi:hypothetical protein
MVQEADASTSGRHPRGISFCCLSVDQSAAFYCDDSTGQTVVAFWGGCPNPLRSRSICSQLGPALNCLESHPEFSRHCPLRRNHLESWQQSPAFLFPRFSSLSLTKPKLSAGPDALSPTPPLITVIWPVRTNLFMLLRAASGFVRVQFRTEVFSLLSQEHF